ncbi:MAG: STAS domain-containing protein [Chloroflexota bacterium]|nr:STAS domain-containing protein [Chloroflexota bacterium]
MEITVKEFEQAELITINGRLDSVEAPRLAQALETANHRGKYQIVVDMSRLEYMSSAGFRALGDAQHNSKRHHGEVLLVQVPDNVRDALEMVGFADYFHVFEDVNSALAFAANLHADDSHKDDLPPLS